MSDDAGYWYLLELNPEPWAIGTISTGRGAKGQVYARMSPNENLVGYREAVKEQLENHPNPVMLYGHVEIEFYFWRQIEEYETPTGRKKVRKAADVTNLQKALEDALQGLLLLNDDQTRIIRSEIVEQSRDITGRVVIHVREAPSGVLSAHALNTIPMGLWEQMAREGEGTQPLLDDDGEAGF